MKAKLDKIVEIGYNVGTYERIFMAKEKHRTQRILLSLAGLAVVLWAGNRYEQSQQEHQKKQKQPATIVGRHVCFDKNNQASTQIFLDTDGNTDTLEALCEIDCPHNVPPSEEELDNQFPLGTTKSMLEWKRRGNLIQFSRE